jgi:hypothetical protein
MRLGIHFIVRIALLTCAAMWLGTQWVPFPYLILGLSLGTSAAEFWRFIPSTSSYRLLSLVNSVIDPCVIALLVPQIFVSPILAWLCIASMVLLLAATRKT